MSTVQESPEDREWRLRGFEKRPTFSMPDLSDVTAHVASWTDADVEAARTAWTARVADARAFVVAATRLVQTAETLDLPRSRREPIADALARLRTDAERHAMAAETVLSALTAGAPVQHVDNAQDAPAMDDATRAFGAVLIDALVVDSTVRAALARQAKTEAPAPLAAVLDMIGTDAVHHAMLGVRLLPVLDKLLARADSHAVGRPWMAARITAAFAAREPAQDAPTHAAFLACRDRGVGLTLRRARWWAGPATPAET